MENLESKTPAPVAETDERHEEKQSEHAPIYITMPAEPTRRKGILRRFIWPAVKVPLYAAIIFGVVVLLLLGLERLAEYGLSRTYLGQVYPDNPAMARRDFTRPVSHYDYDFNPGVCLEYNTLKGNRYEYANNAGFREPRDISTEKPADEFRIFLVGGSTAYGLGAVGEAVQAMDWYGLEYRETISHQMEMILNATAPIPGKKIRVYNASVWGYSYQHHLMRYLAKLRRYKPDLIVSLDGANEIAPLCKITKDWDYFKEGQFNNILRDMFAYNRAGLSSYLTLWLKNNTFLMTYFWGGRDVFTELHQKVPIHEAAPRRPAAGGDPSKISVDERSKLLNEHADTVVRVVENYHLMMANDQVPHMLVLQPWFYLSKKKLSEKEKLLEGMAGQREYYGVPSGPVYKVLIEKLVQSAKDKQYFLVDLHDYFDDVSEWVFTDWCHLTAGANHLVAKELSNLIKEHLLGQALGPGDDTRGKDSFFWDMAASAEVAFAPEPDSPDNGPKNMLAGYPGDALYSSKPPKSGERFEVVLDVGETHPVSRLRLVWADESSVPDQWMVDVSVDGKEWKTLCQGDNKRTDNYSRWPGFEYLAAQPLPARFLRYRPLGTVKGPIRLRCWSVSR